MRGDGSRGRSLGVGGVGKTRLALLASGRDEGAERTFEEAPARVRPTENPSLTRSSIHNLAQSALARGDREGAERLLEEAVGLAGRGTG